MLPSVFPLEVFLYRRCTSPVILLQKGASCKHPAPPPSVPLQAISRPLAPPSSLLPPWGSSETGRQQLFSQHPGPFHTTGIMPSLHLIKVTPAYLYSCPTLAPLDLLSHTSVTAAHTHTHTRACTCWLRKKKKSSLVGKEGFRITVVSKADVAQQ